jgi:pSer/pThr/pTyr-binding forkhead associated (FHA) protein
MTREPVLRIELGIKEKVLRTYAFTQDVIEIGRIPSADIPIDNTGISRAHTRIEKTIGGPYVVKDLGSTNGTWLNGERISEKTLRSGDVIAINKFRMRVLIEEPGQKTDGQALRSAEDLEGTTVLSPEQISKLQQELNDRGGESVDGKLRRGLGQNGFNRYQTLLWGILILTGLALGAFFF